MCRLEKEKKICFDIDYMEQLFTSGQLDLCKSYYLQFVSVNVNTTVSKVLAAIARDGIYKAVASRDYDTAIEIYRSQFLFHCSSPRIIANLAKTICQGDLSEWEDTEECRRRCFSSIRQDVLDTVKIDKFSHIAQGRLMHMVNAG
eukprot:TRINITY_DN10812_c0_g2_i1.p1 TRINITY_DN10812_c0_g2~~TRINITY_DN10812_c0_g2_i1.p1  ORF type:complete len:145 (-),score=13.76 TRINITY_DN10812_c0_g2_i1:73-507(-)